MSIYHQFSVFQSLRNVFFYKDLCPHTTEVLFYVCVYIYDIKKKHFKTCTAYLTFVDIHIFFSHLLLFFKEWDLLSGYFWHVTKTSIIVIFWFPKQCMLERDNQNGNMLNKNIKLFSNHLFGPIYIILKIFSFSHFVLIEIPFSSLPLEGTDK